ncbi:MAG: hypothetical protein U9R75_11550 [Candidatus Thermoplasmatota archaeon]|nr:hypothetical protein [Candidatus Thermoplasmatota archaeon]
MRDIIKKTNGAMEGVPIQLIIVVAVGMAALAILIGWLAFAGDTDATLRSIETEPDTISIEGDGRVQKEVQVTVFVYDSESNEVDGAVVTFSGSVDENVVMQIDSGDTVTIDAVLASSSDTATINVKAEKSGGMGTCSTTIIVMRGQS